MKKRPYPSVLAMIAGDSSIAVFAEAALDLLLPLGSSVASRIVEIWSAGSFSTVVGMDCPNTVFEGSYFVRRNQRTPSTVLETTFHATILKK
jgi:hypothetical protein